MYRRGEKTSKEEKPKKTHKNMPSFSSTLLDEIYRSIDGNAEKTEDLKSYTVKKQGSIIRAKNGVVVEDEFRRACMVEKWIEKEVTEKVKTRPSLLLHDNDLLFFSSTSCSNSDSSGQLSTSSDNTEFFGSKSAAAAATTKPPKVVSCFSTARPKPVRTSVHPHEHEDSYLFDDYKNIQKNKTGDNDYDSSTIKSKSRALKIYANLKKVKQPISPGMKLTNFINSLFNNNGNGKKSKNDEISKGCVVKSATNSTCSSASSFSRSCLSKYPPQSRDKLQRTVRFNPVSVIVDEESRPCGKKSIYDEEILDRFGRPPLPLNAVEELKSRLEENNRKVEGAKRNVLKEYHHRRNCDENDEEDDDDDDDDAMSDTSSDLFELDHLLIGNGRFCEELPVYETTNFKTNRAISSGLIR